MTAAQLVHENIHFLEQGRHLLGSLDDALFRQMRPELSASPVGRHFRHALDHYDNFLDGLETGRINYGARQRDARIETSRPAAAQKISAIVERLQTITKMPVDRRVFVNSNEGSATNSSDCWLESTLGRELQFLISHTVHHYAILAMILRAAGLTLDRDFGVAPSTLKYERSRTPCAP